MNFDIEKYCAEIQSDTANEKFEGLAMQAFYFQYMQNPVYHRYCDLLGIDAGTVNYIEDVPFMPVEFFKAHKVICDGRTPKSYLPQAVLQALYLHRIMLPTLKYTGKRFWRDSGSSTANLPTFAFLGCSPLTLNAQVRASCIWLTGLSNCRATS